MTGDIMLHADFIERDKYLDSFCAFTNTVLTKYKKWEVCNPKPYLTIWFSDIQGNVMKPWEDETPPVPRTDKITDFVLELLLIY
jgi:hypothetical protein